MKQTLFLLRSGNAYRITPFAYTAHGAGTGKIR